MDDINKLNFPRITTQSEYTEKRFNLVNSMNLFFCYDPNVTDETWVDFLNEVNENYKKHINIVLVR